MHLSHLRLRDFRNYGKLDVDFSAGFHLLLGDNGQGKTNILEAIYLFSTLRSFRGVGNAQMVRQGQTGFFVGGTIVGQGDHEVKMYWSPKERKLSLDGQVVRRLTDYWGTLRTVVFCTEDLQLIKGVGRARRRFLDLLLAQTYRSYLGLLQRYAQALRSRNALLKRNAVDEVAVEGFTVELVRDGEEIMRMRREIVPLLAPLAEAAYRRISNSSEELQLQYRPGVKGDFAVMLKQSHDRERSYGATLIGPHRDELDITLDGRSASQFGSEGQKRTIAIALKIAQAEYLLSLHGSPPVLLIDDVMGELDAKRRAAFVPLLQRTHQASGQVFMTATEENWPDDLSGNRQKWRVTAGTLRKE